MFYVFSYIEAMSESLSNCVSTHLSTMAYWLSNSWNDVIDFMILAPGCYVCSCRVSCHAYLMCVSAAVHYVPCVVWYVIMDCA